LVKQYENQLRDMDFRRLFDLLPYQEARFPNPVALARKVGLRWDTYSTQDCIRETRQVSAGLLDLGLKRGDRIAILAPGGSPQWLFLDIGMQQIGVIPVPIHAASSNEELFYILQEAEVLYCIAANREQYERALALQPRLAHLRGCFAISALPDAPSWEQLTTTPTPRHLEAMETLRAAIHEDDLATILYTSGTTGEPKGVMLSHKNLVSNIKAVLSLIPANYTKRAVSFLPLSHIFERMVAYTYLAVGASLYFAPADDELAGALREVRPHYFTAVPRFLEKAHDNILARINRSGLLARKLGHWAIRLGEQYKTRHRFGWAYRLQWVLADILVYRLWRLQLGGRVEGVFVGAAALQPRLGRLFSAAGVPIKEGYGLTETSPVVSFNRFEPGGTRFGTVGIPLPGLEVKIDAPEGQDGEILVRGPNVMMGYYRREEETRAVLDEEGWFRTGDVGRIVHRRFLQITGRKKDVFKTSSGKYVAPQEIETALKSSPLIEDCLAIGFQRPFVAAIVLPNFEALQQACEEHGIHWTAPPYMVHNHKVWQLMQQEIHTLNEDLPSHKRVRNILLLHEPWTVESGELTPTLKPRREIILDKFSREVEQLYEQGSRI
jgi:long-chain acyl-CoA synthetase